jgi:hypothetical protein
MKNSLAELAYAQPQHTPGYNKLAELLYNLPKEAANALLNPESGMDVIKLADMAGEKALPYANALAEWALYNVHPAGAMWKGAGDTMQALTAPDMPTSERIGQAGQGVFDMLTSFDPVPEALIASALAYPYRNALAGFVDKTESLGVRAIDKLKKKGSKTQKSDK